jgi:hypothetical protein
MPWHKHAVHTKTVFRNYTLTTGGANISGVTIFERLIIIIKNKSEHL